MNIVIFGPPGAGKGTQAGLIVQRVDIPQVSTGDIFRRHLKEGTELGKKAKSYMESGALVPDELVFDIAKDRLLEPDCADGALLDGFPRSLPQAVFLDKWLHGRDDRVHLVVNLQVPDEEVVKRMGGRRSCLNCGATYHVTWNPPASEGVCDRCGKELIQRSDDLEATVRDRLKAYHEQTSPIVDHYREQGVVADVDGVGSIEVIFEQVIAAIEARQA